MSEGKLIPNILFGDSSFCFYCGAPRKITIDHCIPVSRLTPKPSFSSRRRAGLRVFACFRCNRKLGKLLFMTLLERFDFVRDVIKQERFIDTKDTIEWIEQLGFMQLVCELDDLVKVSDNKFFISFTESFLKEYSLSNYVRH